MANVHGLAPHLRAMRGRRVAVIGDAMLDASLWGDATRISPEAPVAVVLLERQSWALGGAANVAANIAALGGRALLSCVVGADGAGRRLRRMAAAQGIEVGGVLEMPRRPTTVKYRVLARNKHLLRVDREQVAPLPEAVSRRLLAALAAHPDIEAVVVSDYAKGGVTPGLLRGLARWCAARGIPWCVDPKQAGLRYRGAAVLKPNRSELEALTGLPAGSDAEVRRAGARLLQRLGCRHVLVTRGPQGMVLLGADGSECWIDGGGQAVADVTGAGDTVSAVLGLGLAAGLPLPAIAVLANRAGAYVVSQPGIAVVRPENLTPGGALIK